MRKPKTVADALDRLQGLCARSEQCSDDMRRKLANWMIPAPDADKIIARLKKERFIDDARFARAYARDKLLYSGWGQYKIMKGLMMKRIPRDLIDDAIDTLDPNEITETAERVLRSKARSIKEGNTYEGRTKLFRFGASRGFDTKLLSNLIRHHNLWAEPDED